MKRVSRLVVLPDYQGVGIGYQFLNAIAKLYTAQGFDFRIVTSAKNLIWKLYRSPDWKLKRLDVTDCVSKKSTIEIKRTSIRTNCKTAGFQFVG